MDRTSRFILILDVLALCLPTRGLGPRMELSLAMVLLLATGWVWFRLKADDEALG